jgi:hypothetical protein
MIKWDTDPLNNNELVTVPDPFNAHLWRDDRMVVWMLVDPPPDVGWGQSSGAVVMDSKWFEDGGLEPMPLGDVPASGPDQRMYVAMGPPALPLEATEAVHYTYDLLLPAIVMRQTDDEGNEVDPDISNQPHPP